MRNAGHAKGKRAAWGIRAGAVLMGMLSLAVAAAAAGNPKIKDDWLAAIGLDELRRTVASGEYAALAERIRAAIRARLSCGAVDPLEALTDLVYVLRGCEYLPLAEQTPGGRNFARWLIEQPMVSRPLFRALAETKDPNQSLENLHELWRADPQAVVAYPGLAVAFATSTPSRNYAVRKKAATLLESFQYYTHPRRTFAGDLRAIPFELARYLADTRLSIEERDWAVQEFAGRGTPAHCYFDVPYDKAAFRHGARRKIADQPYTLPNLLTYGGTCGDQAYFASEVCKALGLPATPITGINRDGGGHCWVACFGPLLDRPGIGWDTETGRYKSHKYYLGRTHDPATGKTLLESELILLGAAVQLPADRRERADAALYLARLIAKFGGDETHADTSILTELATAHDDRFARNHRRSRADVTRLALSRTLDDTLVEDLLAESVWRNLAYSPAWDFLVKLRQDDRVPVDHLDRFFDVLMTQTATEYPDYSCFLILRVVPTISDPARRLRTLQRALEVYKERPDLQGRAFVGIGDHFRRASDSPAALEAYHRAVLVTLEAPEVLMDALRRAEALLRETQREGQVTALYADAFERVANQRHGYSAAEFAFREQTTYYQIGRRLVAVLREAGQEANARFVLDQLEH